MFFVQLIFVNGSQLLGLSFTKKKIGKCKPTIANQYSYLTASWIDKGVLYGDFLSHRGTPQIIQVMVISMTYYRLTDG